MKNILIDTCSWQDLLSNEESKLLPYLQHWAENDIIRIFTHEEVLTEWNNNKEKDRERYKGLINTEYNHTQKFFRRKNLNIPISLDSDFKIVDNQIEIIDNLLDNATVIRTSTEIKAICGDKSIARKAPFHNNLDSTKDAYIVFATLDYFTKNLQPLFFVSSNKNDFGDPDNLDRMLHPEIIEDYSEIHVEYYSDIGRLVNDLKRELPSNVFPAKAHRTKIEESLIKIDTSKHEMDQLHEYLNLLFRELKFLPPHLWINNAPLKTNSNSYPYYSLFTIYLDNDNLFNLFESIEILTDNKLKFLDEELFNGVDKLEDKTKFIFNCLTNNLVNYISHRTKRANKVSLTISKKHDCNCPKCNLKKLNFPLLFDSLGKYDSSPEDLIELGYVHYKIGNFESATKVLEQVTEQRIFESKKMLGFISQYNLSKLYIFLKNNVFEINRRDELLQKLKSINLGQLSSILQSQEYKKIFKWIREEKFYSTYNNELSLLKDKIVEQYYSSLNKGYSSNSHVQKLVNEYAELVCFLNENNLIYDKFNEFLELHKIFVEGLFASHGIEETHYSRLSSFSDWLLRHLIYYSDAEHLVKTFRRYKLKKLKYGGVLDEGLSFYELINNFFDYDVKLKELYNKICDNENRTFRDYYNKLFSNILTLMALCNLEKKFINDFVPRLIHFLQNEEFVRPHKLKYLRLFIERKGNLINISNLKKFFLASIEISKCHEEAILESLVNQIKLRNSKIRLSKVKFSRIVNLAFEECALCSKSHLNTTIIPIAQIIQNQNYLEQITQRLNNRLEENFDFNLYYHSRIYEVIEHRDDFFEKSLIACIPKTIQKGTLDIYTSKENQINESLNDLINLCFKEDRTFPPKYLKQVKNLNHYYAWLLDMQNFDYKNFEPEWIAEYVTRFYYKKIASSKETKMALDNYLKDNVDRFVERYYLDIYLRKAWDV